MKRNLRKFSSLVLVLIMLLSTVKPVYAEGPADGQSVPPAEMSQTETDENNEEAAPAESVKETPAEEDNETPAEEVNETPAEEVNETPAEEVKETPAEEVQETPVEEVQETPVEEVQETPVEEVKETPAEEVKGTPTEEVQEAPAEEVQETPAEEVKETPAEEVKETPAEEVKETPVVEVQETPVEESEETPAEEPEETPAEEPEETPAKDDQPALTKNMLMKGAPILKNADPSEEPVFDDSTNPFTYTHGDMVLSCSKLGDGELSISITKASGDVVIPEKIGDYTVTTVYSVPKDVAAGITSLTLPDTVRTIPGNLFEFRQYKNENQTERWNIKSNSTISYSVLDTDALEAAVPDFIKNNYVDGAYYAGKCLVRVDPSYSGNFTVKDGTICVLAGAFAGCKNLGAVTLPDTVEYLGVGAFQDSGLTSINLPKGLDARSAQVRDRIESGEITYINDLTIETLTFYGCENLKTVTIDADNIYSVGFMAFFGCTALEEFDMRKVSLVNSLSFALAFAEGYELDLSETEDLSWFNSQGGDWSSCAWGPFLQSGLSSVKFGEEHFGIIPYECFCSCPNLETVTFTPHQIECCTRSFYNCGKLTGDLFAENSGMVKLEYLAFGKTGLTEITIPETMLYLCGGVFTECPKLKTLNWKSELFFAPQEKKPEYSLYNGNYSTGQLFAILDNSTDAAFGKKGHYESQYSSYDYRSMGNFAEALEYASNMDSYEDKTTLETLNIYVSDDAFVRYNSTFWEMQPNLETVNIHAVWKTVPYCAFQACASLKNFNMDYPEQLKNVYENAFAICGFEELVLPGNVSYDKGAFCFNRNLKKVVIEEGVTELPFLAFERCEKLTQVSIPESLEAFGVASFKGAGDHLTIYVPTKVEVIEDDAFT